MCGILAFVASPFRRDWSRALDALHNRGPDGSGMVECGDALLAHRRLAIIDVSGGVQPMQALEGRFTVTFNGEIYNFRELRSQLTKLGHAFETHSDTEVVLRGFIEWGADVVTHLDGMFGFAIWDSIEQRLFVARDRLGIKPLFYSTVNGLVVASTLKPFFRLEGFPRRLDYEALRDFLAFQTVLAPHSILADVRQLPPASYFYFQVGDRTPRVTRYWDIPAPQPGAETSREELIEVVDHALCESVERQMVADVPLGAFLSGGIDSALMVHYMAQAGVRPLRTFSMKFAQDGYDESSSARRVADQYATEHHVLEAPQVDADALIGAIRELDQPLADPAYVATKALAELTRQSVTVAISGDGGDELFGGYARYCDTEDRFPDTALKRLLRRFITAGFLPGSLLRRTLSGRDMLLYRHVELGPYEVSRKSMKHYLSPDAWQRCLPQRTLGLWTDLLASLGTRIDTDSLMRADLWTYLSENCLMKTDRASMAHSLEVRVPMLANTVLDTVLPRPVAVHFDGSGKAVLRTLAKRYLPAAVWDRPKHGFSVPLEDYFNNQWRRAGDEYFERSSELAPFLNEDETKDLWGLAKQKKASRRLAYTILVLLIWLEKHQVNF